MVVLEDDGKADEDVTVISSTSSCNNGVTSLLSPETKLCLIVVLVLVAVAFVMLEHS